MAVLARDERGGDAPDLAMRLPYQGVGATKGGMRLRSCGRRGIGGGSLPDGG